MTATRNRVHKLSLWAEFLLLFVGLPTAFFFDLLPYWKLYWLLGFTFICTVWLVINTDFDNRTFYRLDSSKKRIRSLLLRASIAAPTMFALVLFMNPSQLFGFPQHKPLLWLLVMCFYPLISALPQELIYRVFMFKRYESLFSGWIMIAVSSVTFSFLHIMYDNMPALGLTLLGGVLLSNTYRITNSLLWTAIEHAVYGCLAFTIGLGTYFYEARIL